LGDGAFLDWGKAGGAARAKPSGMAAGSQVPSQQQYQRRSSPRDLRITPPKDRRLAHRSIKATRKKQKQFTESQLPQEQKSCYLCQSGGYILDASMHDKIV
jgi:hypothetical protein